MADWTQDAGGYPAEPETSSTGARAGLAAQITGAVVSVALLAGMGVWGYRLVVRDAQGVPVVRAMGGPMREAPDNPGGELALHTGLAVNAVAAVGEAAPPEDTLLLAPVTADLTEEDLLVQPTAEAGEVVPEGVIQSAAPLPAEPEPEPIQLARTDDAPMSEADILALADQITAGAEPLTELSDAPIVADSAVAAAVGEAMAALAAEQTDPPSVEVASADDAPLEEIAGGLARALRPPARPGTLTAASSAVTPEAAPGAADAGFAVSTTTLPAGTVLVQLGAYDSPDMAGTAWQTLAGDFGDFMEGKERLIQEAASGGRAFFRLRATGFADLDEARRFCSALVAEDAACIPVVVR